MEFTYLKDIPPKASKVKITHLITTSSFWVVSDLLSSKKRDLHRLEENLCLYCSRARWDPHYIPTNGEVSAFTKFLFILFENTWFSAHTMQ